MAQCPDHAQAVSDHSTAVTDGLVSTIGFAAGGAGARGRGGPLLHGALDPAHPRVGLHVVPVVGRDGASAVLLGTF